MNVKCFLCTHTVKRKAIPQKLFCFLIMLTNACAMQPLFQLEVNLANVIPSLSSKSECAKDSIIATYMNFTLNSLSRQDDPTTALYTMF